MNTTATYSLTFQNPLTGLKHEQNPCRNRPATARGEQKKVQLIYAFNGTGKTRLSRAMKELIAPRAEDGEEAAPSRQKIIYFNAFTEDLFYWDNDLKGDGAVKLMKQPNSFTDWILVDQGQEVNITRIFQHYSNATLTPTFNQAYTRGQQYDGRYEGDALQVAIKKTIDATVELILAHPTLATTANTEDQFEFEDAEQHWCDDCGVEMDGRGYINSVCQHCEDAYYEEEEYEY